MTAAWLVWNGHLPASAAPELALALGGAAAAVLCLATWLLSRPEKSRMLELQVISAEGLAQADEGTGRQAMSDPYALIFHNDRLVGRTPPGFNNHDPTWRKQHFRKLDRSVVLPSGHMSYRLVSSSLV